MQEFATSVGLVSALVASELRSHPINLWAVSGHRRIRADGGSAEILIAIASCLAAENARSKAIGKRLALKWTQGINLKEA
jgi:hypothetical protein